MLNFPTDIPLSLYIHMPWCVKKCPYCDFNSHQLRAEVPVAEYIVALLADLRLDYPKIAGRKINTIFFGGGTPSLFPPASIATLLQGIQEIVPFVSGEIEITLEANPGALEQSYLAEYLAAGINRISIGAQSFQDDKLQALGRIHSSKDIGIALAKVAAVGFNSFNIDLMFGLPGQSVADAMFDLQAAIELKPAHLSWYQLTLEPNTAFYKLPPQLPSDDRCWQIQQAGYELLQANNFQQYEVSAFAQAPELQCQHNLNYWGFGDYLGIGAGAHSKITQFNAGGIDYIERFWKHKHPKTFLAAATNATPFTAECNRLPVEQIPFEFMLNALRLTAGVPKELFTARTGLPISSIDATLSQALERGFMVDDSEWFKTTNLGKRFLNELLQLFL